MNDKFDYVKKFVDRRQFFFAPEGRDRFFLLPIEQYSITVKWHSI